MYNQILIIIIFFSYSLNSISQEEFITTWQISIDNDSIIIPTYSEESYLYSVDWGDGTKISGYTGDATHKYTKAGNYQVAITGKFPRIYFRHSKYYNSNKIISIDQWGNQKWHSMSGAFTNCHNLAGQASDTPDLSLVTDLEEMFHDAYSFNQDISNWDVSKVENMRSVFYGAYHFNQDIGNWDVSNVRNMAAMFYDAYLFNQDIGNWDVSNVTNMHGMFFRDSSFNQDIGRWDVSNVTSLRGMFCEAVSFNQDISKWDVSNVTDMGLLFYDAFAFNHNIEGWDVSSTKDMSLMFHGKSSFNQDISNWDVSQVESMHGMFWGASSFNQDIGKWDVSNVRNMRAMFGLATSFNQDIGDWDVSNVRNMGGIFYGARSFNQDISSWDVSKATDMADMFSNAISFNQNIGGWDVKNTTNMYSMFNGASSFNQNIGNWDVSNVAVMDWMFSESKLSTENYDSLLIGWSKLELKNGVRLHAGSSKYCKGKNARNEIITKFNWTIKDYGVDPKCSLQCSKLLNPENNSIDVDITSSLSWSKVQNATGYKLNIGTSSGHKDILDNFDVGNTTMYKPASDFLCNSKIFVTIVPYNKINEALNCSEESFSTENVEANAGNDVSICSGDSIQLHASGGTNYLWSESLTLDNDTIANPIATPDSTTTYIVNVSNMGRCQDSDSIIVIIHDDPGFHIDATHESGFEMNDGTASIHVDKGEPPFTCNWSFSDTSFFISNLKSGTYYVTVTDANGCFSVDSVTIDSFVCPSLTMNIQKSNMSCFDNCDGSIKILDVNNSVAPVVYKWSNGDSTSIIDSLCNGEYICTTIDASNCSVTDTFVIEQPDEINIIVEDIGDIRNDTLGYIHILTNKNKNYIFEWSGPNNFKAITKDLDSLINKGCYILQVTDTLNNCFGIKNVCIEDKTAASKSDCENIAIYPNPSSGIFTIKYNKKVLSSESFSFFDLSGKNLNLSKQVKGGNLFISSKQISNIYLIKIQSKFCGTHFKKIVIVK